MKLILILILPFAYGQLAELGPNGCPSLFGEMKCPDHTIRCPSLYNKTTGCYESFTCNPKFFKNDNTCMAFCMNIQCKKGERLVFPGVDENNCQMQPLCVSNMNPDPEAVMVQPEECDKTKGEKWCQFGFDEYGMWLGSYCAEEC